MMSSKVRSLVAEAILRGIEKFNAEVEAGNLPRALDADRALFVAVELSGDPQFKVVSQGVYAIFHAETGAMLPGRHADGAEACERAEEIARRGEAPVQVGTLGADGRMRGQPLATYRPAGRGRVVSRVSTG